MAKISARMAKSEYDLINYLRKEQGKSWESWLALCMMSIDEHGPGKLPIQQDDETGHISVYVEREVSEFHKKSKQVHANTWDDYIRKSSGSLLENWKDFDYEWRNRASLDHHLDQFFDEHPEYERRTLARA